MNTNLQLIQDYLSGKLGEEQALEVQLYLAEHMDDPDVAALLELRFESCRSEADNRTEQSLGTTRRRLNLNHHPYRRAVLWAAAATLAFLIAIPVAFQAGWQRHQEPAPIVWQECVVPVAQTRSITLPDGTQLALNAGSRVTWPDRFTGGTREIFLDGEVLAVVAKDSEHPFIIHSGQADIRVYGTTFDLKAYRNAQMLEVMLREGSVGLDIPTEKGKREVRLTPGDLAQYDKKAGELSVGKIPPESYRNFSDEGSFSFINTPLLDIAADLERSFGKRIVVADDRVATQRFLAFFTNGESLDEILQLLSRNGGLRTVRRGDTTYIYKK